MDEREEKVIEQLSEEAEESLAAVYTKKDLKERRSVAKNSLYDGTKKLKHSPVRGK